MPKFPIIAMLALGLALTACTPAPRYTGRKGKQAQPAGRKGLRPLAAPSIRIRVGMILNGISSFYGPDFHGKQTANGEIYDMYGVSAAHKTMPFNTNVRVTNLANGKSLLVRINDRGPFVKGRILDLSYGAALKLGFVAQGTTRVRIEVIEVGDNKFMKHLPTNP